MIDWKSIHDEKKTIRKQAYQRENGNCFWCDQFVPFKKSTIDHIIPESRGGKLDIGNVVLSCDPCNNERGSMPAPDYLWKSVSRVRA